MPLTKRVQSLGYIHKKHLETILAIYSDAKILHTLKLEVHYC